MQTYNSPAAWLSSDGVMWCSGGSNQRGFITPGGVFHAPIHKGREVQDQVEAWLRSCSSRAKSMLGTCSISRSGKIAGLRTCSTAKSGTSKGSLASAQCQHEIMEVQDLPWSLEFATRKKLFVKVVYKNLQALVLQRSFNFAVNKVENLTDLL